MVSQVAQEQYNTTYLTLVVALGPFSFSKKHKRQRRKMVKVPKDNMFSLILHFLLNLEEPQWLHLFSLEIKTVFSLV